MFEVHVKIAKSVIRFSGYHPKDINRENVSGGRMLYRIRKFQRSLHNMACRGIVDTPPIKVNSGPLPFSSTVSTADFVMYLAAMKSMYRQMREGRVVTIDDGSLTQEQRDLLRKHLDSEVRHIKDAPKRRVPKGGTWERLTSIVELSRDSYVIQ